MTRAEDPDQPDAPNGAAGVAFDAGEERSAAAALRARENWYRALIENASDLITVLDDAGRFVFKSPSTHGALGYEPEALIGLNVFDYIHPEDLPTVRRVLAASRRRANRVLRVDCRFRAADGRHRILSSKVVNLLEHPDVRGVVVNSRDVTQERALERELQQSRRLEAIGRLAGGIAHDFNNILTAIKGSTLFALEELAPDHPARAELEQVDSAADRAAQLTRQLLTFSRRQPARLRVQDLNLLLSSLEPMLTRLIGEHVRLTVTREETPAFVRIDAAQLEQVVINLVVNARDAMPEGGTIEIDVARVAIEPGFAACFEYDVQSGSYVRLRVADSGIGIPHELREHIFEPFFTTKAVGRGTGLGLATAYGIVKQVDGYIWVNDERENGTAFDIYLPAADDPQRPARVESADAAERDPGLAGIHVLLCEDEAVVRSLARRMLEAAGCIVTEAVDGLHALELAAKVIVPIDLLVTDVVMPRMGGRELAAAICQVHPETRVLFISGYPEREIAQRGVLATDAAYLHKPFDRAAFLDAAARALRPASD